MCVLPSAGSWCVSVWQSPEPLLYPFQNLSSVRKEANVLHRTTNRYISLTSLPLVIWGPDWEQTPDQLWDADTHLQNMSESKAWPAGTLLPNACSKIILDVKISRPRARGMSTDTAALRDNSSLSEADSRPRLVWEEVLATENTISSFRKSSRYQQETCY